MHQTFEYDYIVRKLRQFFQEEKGFIEVPAQSRVSILAACENPRNITQYTLGGSIFPCPQTGQMWLEYELLKNPDALGFFCVTTSYRDEPNPIPGRHQRIFPMFEFEAKGDFNALRQLEKELLVFLGFNAPVSITYTDACNKYKVETIEAQDELDLAQEYGSAIFLERFPEHTHPFWNMKHHANGLYNKIDVLLHGMETIGSAEREVDVARMRERFYSIENGEYCALLFSHFGKDRVVKELEEYFTLPMFERFGAGIGVTRLARAMHLEGLLDGLYKKLNREKEAVLIG